MKILKKITVGLLLVFVALQFYRPQKNISNGNHAKVFVQETNPSTEVLNILRTACYDCHSNNTEYPWYNQVAPISFWLSDHIKDGKKHLNFSDWENYTKQKKDHKLEEIIEEVQEGGMPLKEYTWTHKEANLSNQQTKQVIEWATKTRLLYQLGKQPN